MTDEGHAQQEPFTHTFRENPDDDGHWMTVEQMEPKTTMETPHDIAVREAQAVYYAAALANGDQWGPTDAEKDDPRFNPPPIVYAEGEEPPEPPKCTCVWRVHQGNRRVPGPFRSRSGRSECKGHTEDLPLPTPWGRDDGEELAAALTA